MARGSKYDHTPVDSIRHADKRANIPTEELRDFVAEEERSPKYTVYPRDPSLDPQLVWKGKDEQDSKDLEVPAVPIYVQEKIHPQALIENLRETAKAGQAEPELTLFDDYDGIEFEELIDFYHHEQNWANRMILGDSLLVMNSLSEKEGLKGQVQMIFMDPPYGIKFGSNWQVSTRKREVKDGKAEDASRQPEQVKAFRDTWELGIHSYLAYMRDRLTAARLLLTDSGSVFVQIGDENVHLVRCVMDEVFGSENFVAQISFQKTSYATSDALPVISDYLLWYAKSKESLKFRPLFFESVASAQGVEFQSRDLASAGPGAGTVDFEFGGKTYHPGRNRHWKTTRKGLERLVVAERLFASTNSLRYKRYPSDFPLTEYTNIWTDTVVGSFHEDRVYVVQTSPKVIARCLLMTTDPGDLVIDPTCGSGTTAIVAEQWGRRWITVDTSRVAFALARTRLMSGRFPYYLLADSAAGAAKMAELTGMMPSTGSYSGDIRKGFAYFRSPRVTLGSIANNEDVKEGMTREQIDRAIARNAETQTLYDRPYEDSNRVRVTGPFTVESLSPHRMLETDDQIQVARENFESSDFATMILENLKRAGVQNTRRDERLQFNSIEPHAGEWVNAVGEYTDATGAARRAGISIGPEHGTVGAEQVKEAAKEAVRGIGFDLLVVLGFAFDAHAGETATEISPDASSGPEFAAAEGSKQYGRLKILMARMNPDLAMGDELLKKTGAGNLFMVFGEPDVDVRSSDDQIVVEVNGVDVYDPTTGQVRSNSTDDIACWFIDTNYNGESFFVRHAYFTGAGDPYDKLKKALRADIDEAAWSTLYSTVSRPFGKPSSGKIAIKVINHYGDEVMKVYEV
jgi:adenine-specific DNA-methyltransferase